MDFTTISGRAINYGDLENSDIVLEDLLHQSMGIRRYLAVIDVPLSVHLVLCTKLVGDTVRTLGSVAVPVGYAAVHDLHECIVCDVPTKLKPYLPDYKRIEAEAEAVVHKKLGLPLDYKPKALISVVDKRALQIEAWIEGHPMTHKPEWEHVRKPSWLERRAYREARAIGTDRKAYFEFMNQAISAAVKEVEKL